MKDVVKIWRSFGYAFRGMRYAYTHDKSIRMEINYGFPIFLVGSWFLFPFQSWEIILYVFSYLLILLVELINTAFEKMLDRLHPDKHPLTGACKDIVSASVFVAFLFAVIVFFVLIASRVQPFYGDVFSGRMFV